VCVCVCVCACMCVRVCTSMRTRSHWSRDGKELSCGRVCVCVHGHACLYVCMRVFNIYGMRVCISLSWLCANMQWDIASTGNSKSGTWKSTLSKPRFDSECLRGCRLCIHKGRVCACMKRMEAAEYACVYVHIKESVHVYMKRNGDACVCM
jgi:hypothetical protein